MREIKFRALGQTDNKWHYGLVSMITEFVCHIASDYVHTWICDTKTLSQYTGLKDKNRTEIYEGDIIEYNKINEVDSHYIGHVLFDKSSWRVNWNDKSCIRKDLEFWAKARDIEVIGNIYEEE